MSCYLFYKTRLCRKGKATLLRVVQSVTLKRTTSAMAKPRVLVSHCEVPEAALDILKPKCDVVICQGLPYPTREELLEKVVGVDGVFLWGYHKIDKEFFDIAGSNLKVLSTMSSGFDHIDRAEARKRGIKLSNTPDTVATSVAELAIGLLLGAARRAVEGREIILNNKWEINRPLWMVGQEISESTVGIVGFGRIGASIAKRLLAFEVKKILYCGHSKKPEGDAIGAEFVSFDTLLQQSDSVIVACPFTPETQGLFNKEAFSKMKSNAVFVNVGRGGVVDQEALHDALVTGKIFAAGLDVMTPEPLPGDHPLLKLSNCVLIPHLGTATVKTRTEMAILTSRNIMAALEGKEVLTPIP